MCCLQVLPKCGWPGERNDGRLLPQRGSAGAIRACSRLCRYGRSAGSMATVGSQRSASRSCPQVPLLAGATPPAKSVSDDTIGCSACDDAGTAPGSPRFVPFVVQPLLAVIVVAGFQKALLVALFGLLLLGCRSHPGGNRAGDDAGAPCVAAIFPSILPPVVAIVSVVPAVPGVCTGERQQKGGGQQ